ncbi:hypothetical protein [Schlesneria sp. T3-172]|uniref:hypothetical protein n=1 Tax=Schlesneria sphaerica TaxID=3373610 RepID=UPI0037CCA9C4
MLTVPSERKKRAWRPWYLMAVQPICTECRVPCVAGSTVTGANGSVVQYRYCPICRKAVKTPCSDLK